MCLKNNLKHLFQIACVLLTLMLLVIVNTEDVYAKNSNNLDSEPDDPSITNSIEGLLYCDTYYGGIYDIQGGWDKDGDGDGDLWYYETPLWWAGWEFTPYVYNATDSSQTFILKVIDEPSGWNFYHSTAIYNSGSITVPAGATVAVPAWGVDINLPNSTATPTFELWRDQLIDCYIGSGYTTFYSDDTAPSSNVYYPSGSVGENFTLKWSGTDPGSPAIGILDYTIQFQVNGGAWTQLDQTDNTQTILLNQTIGNTYCFRSSARDKVGNVEPYPSSADTCVTVTNTPPTTPYNEYPSDNATGISLSADLDWSGGDPDGHSVTYDVYFEANDSSPDNLVCNNTSSSSCSLPTLSAHTHYYWKVIADDGYDTTSSPVWDFYTLNNPPTSPNSPSPSDGASGVSISADLSWNGGDPDGDPVTYDVYFEANDSSPDQLQCNDTSSTSCSLPTLAYNTHYYWKVVANDGTTTTSGSVWDFYTGDAPNSPPYTPTGPSPSDGATGRSINTDLSWSGGDPDGDSVTYDVYFESVDSSPDQLQCNDVASTSCNLPTLAYNTHYYWKVVANDGTTTTSGPVWDFYTGDAPNSPPYAPSSPSPFDGATGRSINTDLSWSGGDPDGDSVTYDVYFEANDSGPDQLQCNDVSSTSCSLPTLAYNTHYYWKVVANDGTTTTSGPVWDFYTGDSPNSPPYTPSSPSPSDGATGRSINTDLYWSGGDPDGDSVTYDVYFESVDSSPDQLQCNDVASTSCNLPTLAYNTHYYWKVVANDGTTTTSGTVWDFWTEVEPPPPTGGDTAASYDPTTQIWRFKSGNNWYDSVTYLQWGAYSWIPLSGDWDNDGSDEAGLYDPSTGIWRFKTANLWNASVIYLQWLAQNPSWLPVAGDWDDDGVCEAGFYEPATGIWRLKTANTWNAAVQYLQWGAAGWQPIIGDWDNDGVDEVGQYDPATGVWRLKTDNTWYASVIYVQWLGQNPSWVPVSGDWDDDGTDEIGFYEPATGIWRMKTANTWNASVQYLQWGASGWKPITGNW